METVLKEYYKNRASEYDDIYARPERQGDIRLLGEFLRAELAGKSVLEVACGTGFWTEKYVADAKAVLGVDCNDSVLQVAGDRLASENNVSFVVDDAFALNKVSGSFNACYAGFWLSHVKKSDLAGFLDVLHQKLAPGSVVIFADNLYVEGNSTPLSRRDEEGNTYQIRRLKDGSEHEILKNFTTEADFHSMLAGRVKSAHYQKNQYFWYGWYQI